MSKLINMRVQKFVSWEVKEKHHEFQCFDSKFIGKGFSSSVIFTGKVFGKHTLDFLKTILHYFNNLSFIFKLISVTKYA